MAADTRVVNGQTLGSMLLALPEGDVYKRQANIISAQVIMKPNCVLGLATGGTPVGTYKPVSYTHLRGSIPLSTTKVFFMVLDL